jgi:hypothetical protein
VTEIIFFSKLGFPDQAERESVEQGVHLNLLQRQPSSATPFLAGLHLWGPNVRNRW